MTIVNCTDVRRKRFKTLTNNRRDVDTVNKYVMQLQYLNKT